MAILLFLIPHYKIFDKFFRGYFALSHPSLYCVSVIYASPKKIMGVQFWNFNLIEAKQGEELYITMNSRGESLSGNENIRAYLLDKETPHHKQARGKEFDIWQEFFWQHRGSNPNADRGFNAFLASVIFIELHKTLADNSTDKPLYTMEGFQKIVGDLYNSALTAELTFEKIRPYYEALERLTTLMTSDGLNKITPKLLEENGKFETYLSGHMDRQGLVFLLPLLAFYAGHPYAKTDARWVRFFYNIAFNQEREALQKMLKLAANARKEGWVDTIDLVGSPDLDEEEKIKLEQLKAHPSQREELEKLYQKLEDHPITKGFIASFINRSLDKGQLDIERLEKYGTIFEVCFAEKSQEILMRRAILACASSFEDTFLVGAGYYSLCRDPYNKIVSFREKYHAYFNLFDKIYDVNHIERELTGILNSKEHLSLPIWVHSLVENAHFLETFYTVSAPNEKYINWLTSWDKRGAWYEFYTYRLSLEKNSGLVPYYERGWPSGAKTTINNLPFYLHYNQGAHPLFSLWIEGKNISKLQGKLGFKPENDWHYIDNLETENKVLALIEQIKRVLV